MDEKRAMAIGASLEGEAAVLRDSGKKVTVSEMELFILVNLAEIGVNRLMAMTEDPEIAEGTNAMFTRHCEAINRKISQPNRSGMDRLKQSGVAMISAGRFLKYVLE